MFHRGARGKQHSQRTPELAGKMGNSIIRKVGDFSLRIMTLLGKAMNFDGVVEAPY